MAAPDVASQPAFQVSATISVPIKYLCLVLLVVQTSVHVLVLRYSRTHHQHEESVYNAATAVLLTEVIKFLICVGVLCVQQKYNINSLKGLLYLEFITRWTEFLQVAVPAALYIVQNNLLFLALSNLDAATYQVTYQLKIFTTALFSVALLGRRLSIFKWFSLSILLIGVVLVQWPDHASKPSLQNGSSASRAIGLCAVLCASLSSGFAGVYFEKVLKGSPTGMWIRNLQLATFGLITGVGGVIFSDWQLLSGARFFQGYDRIVVFLIIWGAVGGLLVGAVVKYADNILKGFAAAISIIVSSFLSYVVLNDFDPSRYFMMGSGAVMVATYLYSLPDPVMIAKTSG